MKFYKQILMVIIWLLLITSCTTGVNLAQQYVVEQDEINVLVLPPDALIKDYFPVHPDSIPIDSFFALEEGLFLYQVEDSLVVRFFMETLISELNYFGIKVFTSENQDSFYQLDSNAHVFSVAQLQLMEFVDQKQEHTVIEGLVYEAEVDVTTLVQNTWFEYQNFLQPENDIQVLFSMQYRSDYIEGWFNVDWRTGEVSYEYVPYRLTLDDVYDLAATAAQQHAQYIFDFLMNQYIRENLSGPDDDLQYYQYDRERHMIQPAYDDRFYVITPDEQVDQE